jgi:hypothetical protein
MTLSSAWELGELSRIEERIARAENASFGQQEPIEDEEYLEVSTKGMVICEIGTSCEVVLIDMLR